jgi:hypothetical protein
MYFDDHGALNMEHVPFPGSIGDACAETARFHLLAGISFEQMDRIYRAFVTKDGYLRHPDAPPTWREADFSGDQAIPLFLLFTSYGMKDWADEMLRRFKEAGWRTGNGRLLALSWIPVIARSRGKQSWLSDLPMLAQSLWLRLFSWTYSDGTADHLNHYHSMKFADRYGHTVTSRLATWLLPHSVVMKHVRKYYLKEPNSAFVVDAYSR